MSEQPRFSAWFRPLAIVLALTASFPTLPAAPVAATPQAQPPADPEPLATHAGPYAAGASFDTDASDSHGNTWPGTWNSAYGEGGSGDGGVQARHLEGPSIGVTAGNTYSFSITGCSASGGGTYFSLRWYSSGGTVVSTQNHSAWPNCPSYQSRDWHVVAPANAADVRFYFTYDNRYDDVYVQDLSALTPNSAPVLASSDFEDGATASDGSIWPGTWGADSGDQGTGDAGLIAYHRFSAAYGVVAGHDYRVTMTGCTTTGGSSQFHVRFYTAGGTAAADNGTADWPACPTFATRQYTFAAPSNAASLRIQFAYNNRYDDLKIEDATLTDAFPAKRHLLLDSFGTDPNGGGTCSLPVQNHCLPETWQSAGYMSTSGTWAVGQFGNTQTQQSQRFTASPGASYSLSIRMKPAGASRWVGFCFYSSDVPLNNNENRLSCETRKAPSFDGYPWRTWQMSAVPPAGTTHVGLYFDKSQSYDDVVFKTSAPPAVPPEHLLGTCSAGHAKCPAHFEVDPVNTATGNYVSTATDLSIPGLGLPFAFSRTYNSLDTRTGALGIGWRHAYVAHVVVNPDDTVLVEAEDGASYLFTPDGQGGFARPPGGRSDLETISGGYELTRPDRTEYRFDPGGNLTAILDRSGNQVSLSYSGGRLASITDTVGRVVTVTHNGAGLLSELTDPLGRSVSYGYDVDGRLTTVTDLRGGVWTYAYDASDRLTTVTDPNSHTVVTNEFGADGRVSAQTDAEGNRGTFAWAPATGTSTYTDARGGTRIDDYDDNRLVSQTDPLGNVTHYAYDADLNRTSVTDPRGNTITLTYDAAGNVLTRTAPAPLGYVAEFTYNSFGDVLMATDGRGNITTSEYDAAGNLLEVTEPGNVVTTLTRDPAGTGRLVSTTDPRGKTTSYAYDAQSNLTSTTDPLGNVTTMTYDAVGRVTSAVDPRGNQLGADPDDFRYTLMYDGDLVVSTTDPLGAPVTTAYDPVGNRLSVTDPLDNLTSYTYDDANRLLTVTDPDLNVTAYAYDDTGNLVTRTDANLHVTTYSYDLAGRLESTTDPLGNDWLLTYDANGNLLTRTDARDQVTTYAYDVLNRRTANDYGPAGTPDVGYAYDANGNLTQLTDGAGTETYAYDTRNRLTSVTRGSDAFTYAYDATGNLTSRTYPGGQVTTYAYDDAGRMLSATLGSDVTTYAYDAAGQLLTTATPDGLTATHTYDEAGRLREVAHVTPTATLSRFTYGLDAAGRRTNLTTTLGATGFTYDDRGQLIEACFGQCPGETPVPELPCLACIGDPLPRPAAQTAPDPADTFLRYTYDAVGNRLSEETHLGTTAYAHDAADRLSTVSPPGASPATYAYDANGNQTAAGADAFVWDAADRLTSATVEGTTYSYAHAGDGRRLSAASAGTTTQFVWDLAFGLPMLIAERDGAGAILRSYAYGLDLLRQSAAGTTSYYHHDGLGSVADLTDPAGASVSWGEYAPFGDSRYAAAATGAPVDHLGFTGEYLDPTGFYHLRARQYDPGLGQFLSLDPVSPALSDPYVASYAYVRNAPTLLTDPSGENPCAAAAAAYVGGPVTGTGAVLFCAAVAALLWVAGTSATADSPPIRLDMPSIDIPPHPAAARPTAGPAPIPTFVPMPDIMDATHPDMNRDLVGRQGPTGPCRTMSCKLIVVGLTGSVIWNAFTNQGKVPPFSQRVPPSGQVPGK